MIEHLQEIGVLILKEVIQQQMEVVHMLKGGKQLQQEMLLILKVLAQNHLDILLMQRAAVLQVEIILMQRAAVLQVVNVLMQRAIEHKL